MKTEKEIVDACNELASHFYAMHGNKVRPAFKFYETHHPLELFMWELAVAAYAHIENTDVENALEDISDGV